MLRNQKEAARIYDLTEMLVSLAEYMSETARQGNRDTVARCGACLGRALQGLRSISKQVDGEQPQITMNNFCRTAECSLLRVLAFRRDYAMKCEFELLPVLQEMRMYFYYWGLVFPDKKKIARYRKKTLPKLAANRYVDQAEKNGHYKYDLTVTIQAYNHLEDATKQCLKSLFEHLPGSINYELILVNNGSTDGTKELFEQFHPTKQFDAALNYGGQLAMFRLYEGRYVLAISNDVFVLHHAIQNMLRCMGSDPDIAFLVPQTPNISNLQTIGISCDCSGFSKEVEEYAIQNNRYDPYRHIQRSRLCNPLSLLRSADFFSGRGVLFSGLFYADKLGLSFPDDAMSILVNRMGKKNVLQKDAFCYHMGQLTIKNDVARAGEQEFYMQGRRAFYREFGIDPWGTGFCFDLGLFQELNLFRRPHIDILGINSGLGDNPLQIKECYKEHLHNTDVALYCVYQNEAAGRSMAGIADNHKLIRTPEELETVFDGIKFDHIVMEDPFSKPVNIQWLLSLFCARLHAHGTFALRLGEQEMAMVREQYPRLKFSKGNGAFWVIGGVQDVL